MSLGDEVYRKNKTKKELIPAVLFACGIVAIESDYLKLLNTKLRDELKENIDEKITLDDFTICPAPTRNRRFDEVCHFRWYKINKK